MMLKAILCVQHFYSFGAMLFTVNFFIKTDSTLICVPRMIEHVCHMSHFLSKIPYLEDNWLDFVYCLKFTSLRPDSRK